MSEFDVEALHRIGKKKKDVVVRFLNRKHVQDCLENCTKISKSNEVAQELNVSNDVYISEHFTAYIGKLAYCCRLLKRLKHIQAYQIHNGICRIKVLAGSNWRFIGHYSDLTKLFSNMGDLIEEDATKSKE